MRTEPYGPPVGVKPDETDDEILTRLGLDPARYAIEHCAHCDRGGKWHPSCLVVERWRKEREA